MTVIEARGRGGQLLERIRSDALQITIGRSFDNDLILEDEFVSPHHLRLTAREKGWLVEDLDSLNGVRRSPGRPVLHSGETLRIGHTTLHVYDSRHEVSDTLALGGAEARLSALGAHFVWPFVLLVMVGVTMLTSYWSTVHEFRLFDVLDILISGVIVIFMFAAFWALLSRLVRHKASFFAHLSFWLLFGIAGVLVTFFASWVGFNTGSAATERLLDLGISAILIGLTFWASLYLATNLRGKLRVLAAVALALGFVVMIAVAELSFTREFHSYPRYYARLHGPGLLWRDGVTEERLAEGLPDLFEQADIEAAREIGNNQLDLAEWLRAL